MYYTLGDEISTAVDYTKMDMPTLMKAISSTQSITFAGFPTANISAYLGKPYQWALVLQKAFNGMTLTDAEYELWSRMQNHPAMGNMRWGMEHLAQHPLGSKVHHGIMKVIRRAMHFTPRSFQFKNIMGAMGSAMATVFTGGLGQLIAPNLVSANSQTMKALGMVSTAIGLSAGAVVLGPAIAGSLGPTLSSAASMSGQAVSAFGTFYKMYNAMNPKQQQELASNLTPQDVLDINSGKAPIESFLAENRQAALATLSAQPPMLGVPPTAPSSGGLSPLAIAALIGVPLAVVLSRRLFR